MERGRNDDAIPLLEKALVLDPGLADGYHYLGLAILSGKGDDRKALYNFLSALSLDSTNADACLGAGMCYNHLGDTLAMRPYLAKYLELKPSSSNSRAVRRLLHLPR